MSHQAHRILIADDEDQILDAYRAVLADPEVEDELLDLESELFGSPEPAVGSSPSFDVVFCRQGDEAVAAAKRAQDEGRPFSVAFLDVRMPPGPTGVEAAKRIRSFDPALNIVFVTGFSDVSAEQMNQSVPPVERLFYVAKPFQPTEITQFASALAHKWQTEQALAAAHAELEARHRALQEREAELRSQSLHFGAALDNMSQGLCMFDAERRLIVCNRRFLNLYGLTPDLIHPGVTLSEVVGHSIAVGNHDGEAADQVLARHLELAASKQETVLYEELTGNRTIAIVHSPMAGGGCVKTHEDVTDRRRAEAKIAHMAHHDGLTGLPNRILFHERLEQAFAQLRRRGSAAAVLCLDLDRFKTINDTLGHPVGDAMLQVVAERLRSSAREVDTVARLGGDEFAIVQVGIDQPQGAGVLAQRLIDVLSEPYQLGDHQVVSGVSIGLAIAPGDAQDPHHLLKNADMALYRAKADGRGTYRFFEPGMDSLMQARRALEMDLRRALVRDELVVHYQPLVDLRSRAITGFEALVRWHHPTRGLIPPGDFITLAEETGIIVPLGEWVLRQACTDACKWPAPLSVSVNISPAQFRREGLIGAVADALRETGLPASRLELEVTEGVLLQDTDAALVVLQRLRDMGVRIAMDDFGTGYSSLSYLRSFPFDKIKIDKSFINDLAHEKNAVAIVQTVLKLGTHLGMVTTAEGVETKDQLDYLNVEGCDQVQGYYFSSPQPAEVITDLLSKNGGTFP